MPIDDDACLICHPDDAALVSVVALGLGQFRLRVRTAVSFDLTALDQCASCVLCISPRHAAPWESGPALAELAARSRAGRLRIIGLLLPAAQPPASLSQLPDLVWVDWMAGDWSSLAKAILGPPSGSPGGDALRTVVPLPPAGLDQVLIPRHTADRPELDRLRGLWADRDWRGVAGLIGVGGAGKTALLTRFLLELPGSGLALPTVTKNTLLAPPDGLFFWNFYAQPDLEYCIHSLYAYLTGQPIQRPARDLAYRIIQALRQRPERRILLVFDGLEVAQEGTDSADPYGSFRDSSLRHLLRSAAEQRLGAVVLLTSRFSLPDLRAFPDYAELAVDALPPEAARAVLRMAGVDGEDSRLDALVAQVGPHALTLELLGALLRDVHAGDPAGFARLPPLSPGPPLAPAEAQGRELARILAFYDQNLPPLELKALEVVCAARMPLPLKVVAGLFSDQWQAANDPAASLPRVSQGEIAAALERLHTRRLLMIRPAAEPEIAAAHLAIRAYFSRPERPGVDAIHQLLIWHYLPAMMIATNDSRAYGSSQFSPHVALLAEAMIAHSIQGSNFSMALTWYRSSLRGYTGLAWNAADYQRGLRITELFSAVAGRAFEANHNVYPWYQRCLFLLDLGYPAQAEADLRGILDQYRAEQAPAERAPAEERPPRWGGEQSAYNWLYYESNAMLSLADALLMQGKLIDAERQADAVCATFAATAWPGYGLYPDDTGANPFGRRAAARALLGQVGPALDDFAAADEFPHQVQRRPGTLPADWYHGALHALLLLRLGRPRAAQNILDRCDLTAARDQRPLLGARYDLALAELHLATRDYSRALPHLDLAFGWAMTSGQREVYARACLGKARLLLRLNRPAEAAPLLREAEASARAGGFAIVLADTLVVAGHLALQLGDLLSARSLAAESLALSAAPARRYAWGRGDAHHLAAEIAAAAGQQTSAHRHARAALSLRASLGDAKRSNTRALLERLGTSIA